MPLKSINHSISIQYQEEFTSLLYPAKWFDIQLPTFDMPTQPTGRFSHLTFFVPQEKKGLSLNKESKTGIFIYIKNTK